MSSRYETWLAATPPNAAKIRVSASIVPWRHAADGQLEIYWVQRSPALAFMGGFMAFPGGGLDKSDAAIPLADANPRPQTFTRPSPEVGEQAAEESGLGFDLVPGLLACAVRELFEECGILLAEDLAPEADLEADRQALLAGERDFASLVRDRAWRLSASELVFAGRWLTPKMGPIRFDNRFFLLHWPADRGQQPSIHPGELVAGSWISPAEALAAWRSGQISAASPPILHFLKVLASDGPSQGLARLLDTREMDLGPERRIEMRPGFLMLPLRVPTLPPASHTNTLLVGQGRLLLIDPASPFPEEQERLLAWLAAARAQGHEILAIALTHHHSDHIGAVERCREALGLPVWAHQATARALEPTGIRVDRWLEDGELLDLDGMSLRVVHTPGHTRGHLCFFDEGLRTLVAGDLVSTLSTIVIDPPEGEMTAYLDSLARVVELGPEVIFPSHGPMVTNAVARLRQLREHRLAREAKVLAAWQAGQHEASAMVAEVYDDTPPAFFPIALRQIEAHLVRLRSLGLLEEDRSPQAK